MGFEKVLKVLKISPSTHKPKRHAILAGQGKRKQMR
jgi:hypothetical protein